MSASVIFVRCGPVDFLLMGLYPIEREIDIFVPPADERALLLVVVFLFLGELKSLRCFRGDLACGSNLKPIQTKSC